MCRFDSSYIHTKCRMMRDLGQILHFKWSSGLCRRAASWNVFRDILRSFASSKLVAQKMIQQICWFCNVNHSQSGKKNPLPAMKSSSRKSWRKFPPWRKGSTRHLSGSSRIHKFMKISSWLYELIESLYVYIYMKSTTITTQLKRNYMPKQSWTTQKTTNLHHPYCQKSLACRFSHVTSCHHCHHLPRVVHMLGAEDVISSLSCDSWPSLPAELEMVVFRPVTIATEGARKGSTSGSKGGYVWASPGHIRPGAPAIFPVTQARAFDWSSWIVGWACK